jgi:YidC/Oxa1 family membrane protein insertase
VLGPLLASLGSVFSPVTVAPAITIPIWDQYVNLIVWTLDHLAQTLHNGGLAIIVFTILVKTIILPLTVQSLRSSKAMQELQPKIKELQKKHGKDRQRLSQETMRLYSQHRVNPTAGCLPMLIQIPIFLGLYRAISHLTRGSAGSEYWNGSFLWLHSLHAPDALHLLPLLAGLFQFVQSRMMRPANQGKISDPQQAMMNTMMNFMPLTVILFGWNFAAGPVLYWATQSVYSVVQQWFITGWGSLGDWLPNLPELPEHRRLGYRPPRPVEDVVVVSGDDDAPVHGGGAMGWLQRKMEEAQRQTGGRRSASADGDNQARADAESRSIAAATETSTATPAASRNGSRRGRGGQRGKGGAVRVNAAARANGAGGGDAVRADDGPRAIVVPRKARQTPGENGKTGT